MAQDHDIVVVGPEATLGETLQRMGRVAGPLFGIAVVTSTHGRMVGILTSGDLIRAFSRGAALDQPVTEWMNSSPIAAPAGLDRNELMRLARSRRRANGEKGKPVRFLPILDDLGRLREVVDVVDLAISTTPASRKVSVIGLGHVGLPLAATLSVFGHDVLGVDKRKITFEQLDKESLQLVEPDLGDFLTIARDQGTLRFATQPSDSHAEIIFIAVGTPVESETLDPDLTDVQGAIASAAQVLSEGTLVVMRSTLPVGTTRNVVVPLLEESSGLEAGVDFHVAFMPERTIEGDAIREIRELPQIISGLTDGCLRVADSFWGAMGFTTVRVDSLEGAEIIKLLNNSFRDHVFAFANAAAALATDHNLDAYALIAAANEGYPRNPIPTPSPGVGGYCLTKDPFIYARSNPERPHSSLALAARHANDAAIDLVYRQIVDYLSEIGKSTSGRVVVAGLAFKGQPETADTRGSTALQIARMLQEAGHTIAAYDAVLGPSGVRELGFEFVDILNLPADTDVVALLNNHPNNTPAGFLSGLEGKRLLLVDSWHRYSPREVEPLSGISYATMGYRSPTCN